MKNVLFLLITLYSVFVGATLILPTCALAADVTLAWNADNPAPEGYWLFVRNVDAGTAYDYSDETYKQPGTATQITVPGLEIGKTYAFVVRAYAGDQVSGDSNEVVYKVSAPPQTIVIPVAPGGFTVTIQYTPQELEQ